MLKNDALQVANACIRESKFEAVDGSICCIVGD